MAESEKRTKTATTAEKKPAGGTKSKTSSAKRGSSTSKSKSTGMKQTTAASKAPAKKKKKTAKSTKSRAQTEAQRQRKSEFTQQFLPYILGVVVIFLCICFVMDAIGGAEKPDEHLMGFLGFYFCQLLFGCFGWAAYLIPALMILLIVFWKRNYEDGSLPIKAILSAVTMILVAVVTHVVCCALSEDIASMTTIDELYETGFLFESGGVIGGFLGYLLYQGFRLSGTIVLSVLVFPLLILYLIGMTPAFVFGKIGDFIKAQMQKSAEDDDDEEDEDDDDEEDEDEEEVAESDDSAPYETYRERRAKAKAKAEEEAAAAREEKARDGKASDKNAARTADKNAGKNAGKSSGKSAGKDAGRDAGKSADTSAEDMPEEEDDNLVVNARTGEVLGSTKSRRGKKKADETREEDMAGLPFYDTPDPDKDEAPFEEDMVYAQNAETVPMEELEDEDMATETMEVGYDDDLDLDENVTLVRNNASKKPGPPAKTPRQKHDPYSSVRILESETSAVAEAGLSEEEIVISSASRAEEGGQMSIPDEAVSAEGATETPAEEIAPPREYVFPPVELLTKGSSRYEANEEEIAENTQILRDVLESFHIRVKEISCSCGPTITRFEVKPDSGVRVRSIANLVDDIAMGLAKAGVRIEAPIPGKAAVGIEVPNAEPATVHFRNILETPEFRNHKSRIAACLGADVSGRPVILDINKMPHLLVAGTTGSGKSVCINSIIMSILYKAKPEDVKLILIDPKKVEFAVYRDLPHLYCPIISDPKKAAGALNSAVNEMERRFELIEEVGVRNLAGYNEVTADDPARPAMPQMVIIIDELADLMMTASNEVETAICRLAQKARAAGIHLILGTQRPSTDVITGLIKANIPSRIAFTVTQQIDSRIIIDAVGAEKLIGRGDMLYSPVGTTKPLRVQGTFISDNEVEQVVTFLRENNDRVEFDESFTRQIEIEAAKCAAGNKKKGEQASIDDFDSLGSSSVGRKDNEDPKFWEALEVAAGKDKIGTSALQRALNLGYGRAAKIIDRMEELGLVGPDPGTKQGRKVLITKQQYLEYRANGLPGTAASSDSTAESGDDGDFDDL